MTIGLNGQKLLIEYLAGPEVYTFNVFRALAKVDKQNKYIVYFDREPSKEIWQEISQSNTNFSYKVVQKIISWTQIGLAIELLRNPVDVFFTATHTIPGIHWPKIKMVSMIHGLEYKINQQYSGDLLRGIIHPMVLWWVIAFSKIVIAPSQATKEAILKLRWPLATEDKIKIVTEGVDEKFYKRSQQEVETIRHKYNLGSSKYLLFVSTIQPRKNIPKMIEGFSLVLKENPSLKDTKLVVSGKNGWLYQESLEAPKKFGIEQNVLFIGRTPDEDLSMLLSGAEAFISCSLEEGFGLPLLEAMACETPAIISDIPAFRELGKDYQIYAEPNNANSIRTGIENITLNQSSIENIKKAKQLSKSYTWESVARELIVIFKNAK